MTTIILLFGILIICMCAWGLVALKAMIEWVLKMWNRPWAIYFAISLRIALGVLFILAADQTRYPHVFNILGYLMIIAAIMIAVVGRKRLDKFIQWWVDSSPVFARVWLVFGMAFGAFIIHAVY